MRPLARLTDRRLPAGAGRKAEHLAWLTRHRFPSPSGWVVPAGLPAERIATELGPLLEPGVRYAVRSSADVEDDEEEQAKKAADDHDEMGLAQTKKTAATKLAFDLDLAPGEVARDRLAGRHLYPEWDCRKGVYLPDHVSVLASTAEPVADGVRVLDAMLRFVPRRYVEPAPLRSLREISEGQEVSAIVQVESFRSRQMRSRYGFIVEATVSDGSDELPLTFFLPKQHHVEWYAKRLPVGATIGVHGAVGRDDYRGGLQLTHPDFETVEDTEEGRAWAQRPRPVYPLKQNISLATMTSQAMPRLKRNPVNMYGSVAGTTIFANVVNLDSRSTFATFQ